MAEGSNYARLVIQIRGVINLRKLTCMRDRSDLLPNRKSYRACTFLTSNDFAYVVHAFFNQIVICTTCMVNAVRVCKTLLRSQRSTVTYVV